MGAIGGIYTKVDADFMCSDPSSLELTEAERRLLEVWAEDVLPTGKTATGTRE